MKFLPHRYPFLLIDRVLDFVPNQHVIAIKNVSVNEPCFTGHFPELPVFPGVLIIEAMAQATGVLTFGSMPEEMRRDNIFVLAAIDEARFKRPVTPGDTLTIKVTIIKKARHIWKFATEARVNEELACSAQIIGALAPRDKM
ncbi:MAG: 3-hydroxyacyl-ACP dehydratase FabZ [Gammaproteobacteria bacterium]|nr:3-hydroxyacyl-ACP dehydratase FabZ [Gammaproteobacteria bacterium]